MKRTFLLLGCAGLLASCAPTITGPVVGRIVNNTTGQEGTVSFTRGTLKPRLDGPYAADNAVINLAGRTYTGRTVIINSGVSAAPTWNASFDWMGGNRRWNNGWGWGIGFDTPSNDVRVSRSGNLIARTNTTPVQTLTCNLSVDVYEHGVGDCLGNDGTKYALQF